MSWATLVLFLHIVAACIWIGGQVTVAVVLPALRGHPDLIRTIGRRFQVLAWSAYGVLIVTGAGNARFMGLGWGDLTGTTEGRLLLEKLGLVLLSGAAAAVHVFVQAPRSRARLSHRAFSAWSAVLGSVSLLAALGAALYGVVIARGG
jgi:putative copper export protein